MRYQLSPDCRKGIDDYGYPDETVLWLLNNTFEAEKIIPEIGMPDWRIVLPATISRPYNRVVRLASFDVIPADTLPEDLFTL